MDSFQLVHEVLMDVVAALSWIVCLEDDTDHLGKVSWQAWHRRDVEPM